LPPSSQEVTHPQLKEAPPSTTPPSMSAVAIQVPSLLPSPRDMMWESRRGPELLSRPRPDPAHTERVELPSIRQVSVSAREEKREQHFLIKYRPSRRSIRYEVCGLSQRADPARRPTLQYLWRPRMIISHLPPYESGGDSLGTTMSIPESR
jgi:hypothetical protein